MEGHGSGRDEVRRGRRRMLLLVVAVVGVSTLVGGFVAGATNAFDVGDSSFFEGDPPGWASVLGAVLVIVGVVVMFGGFVHLVRSGRYRRNAESPLWRQSWSRRRDLGRQIRGKAPVREEDLPLLRPVAAHLADQRAYLVPFGGMLLLQIGQVFRQWAPFWLFLSAAVGLAFVVAAVAARRDERPAREFLRTHPD